MNRRKGRRREGRGTTNTHYTGLRECYRRRRMNGRKRGSGGGEGGKGRRRMNRRKRRREGERDY